jgi:protein-S-isoprenylcysteine O-methyltransferase Ste14
MQQDRTPSSRAVLAAALGGGLLFVFSLGYFLYAYLLRYGAPAGAWTAAGLRPAAVDAALFSLFALHHSWLVRSGVKQRIHAAIGSALERVAYVWFASILFLVVCSEWRPVPGVLWAATGVASVAPGLLQGAGIALAGAAARRLDVLELAGIRQARVSPSPPVLYTDGVYGRVRHPIYLGWVLFVWAVPMMTGTRFVFAAASTIYLALAVPFEERDLARTFGTAYDAYRQRVRWRIVPGIY